MPRNSPERLLIIPCEDQANHPSLTISREAGKCQDVYRLDFPLLAASRCGLHGRPQWTGTPSMRNRQRCSATPPLSRLDLRPAAGVRSSPSASLSCSPRRVLSFHRSGIPGQPFLSYSYPRLNTTREAVTGLRRSDRHTSYSRRYPLLSVQRASRVF